MNDIEYLQEFFRRYYWDPILELYRDYPARKTLNIDYQTFAKFDLEKANLLIEYPDREIKKLNESLARLDVPADGNIKGSRIAISNLPDDVKITIDRIRQENTNKLISIDGRITMIAPQNQELIRGAFKCQRCGEITFLEQAGDKRMEPFECENETCLRKGAFKLLERESVFEDLQKIGLQDLYEFADPGQPLGEITMVLRDDDLISKKLGMGAQVTVTGVVRREQVKDSNVYRTFLEVLHIDPSEKEIDVHLSKEEMEQFETLALDPDADVLDILINSIATSVYGNEEIKLSLLVGLASSGYVTLSDGTRLRKNVHILFVGEPGVAKTRLAHAGQRVAVRSQYAAGRAASSVGLTVSVSQDKLTGRWIAAPGVMVLADGGVCFIDELDKLTQEELKDLNTGMEDQKIPCHKASIHQDLNTRISLIALANPKDARFDRFKDIIPQINVPKETLTRFDLKFTIFDRPDKDLDYKIASKIIKNCQGKESTTYPGTILNEELLRKYVAYVRSKDPILSDDVGEAIVNSYVKFRQSGAEDDLVTDTARAVESLWRITIVIAKLRLHKICTMGDFEKAMWLYQLSRKSIGLKDIDILYGCGKSQRDRCLLIRGIILELQDHQCDGNGVHYNEIIAKAKGFSIQPNEAGNDLQHLKGNLEIIEISSGSYRVAK